MVARFVILLFIFQCVLNVKAFTLSFAKDSIVQGEVIEVLWNREGAKLPNFTLQLLSASSNHLLDSQVVTPAGFENNTATFSSKKLQPGHCYAKALDENLTELNDTEDHPLTILDPNAPSTATISSSSSTTPTTNAQTASSSSSTTTTNSITTSTSTTSSSSPTTTPQTTDQVSASNHTNPIAQATSSTSSNQTAAPVSTSTSSSTPTPPTSVDSTSTNTNHSSLAVILGAVLGSIVGLGLLICLTLLFLRRRRRATRESTPSFFPSRMIASIRPRSEKQRPIEVLKQVSEFKYGTDSEDSSDSDERRRLEDWKYGPGPGASSSDNGRGAEEYELYHFPMVLSATSRPREWGDEDGLQ